MPLFFLLSGFSLALAYGKTEWEVNCCCRRKHEEGPGIPSFRSWDFYRNRFARIGPLYYMTSFLAYPIWLLGKNEFFDSDDLGKMIVRIVATITCTGSWLFPAETWPANLVSWTFNTLFFFYLVFPFILPKYRKCPTNLYLVGLFFYSIFKFYPLPYSSLAYLHLASRIKLTKCTGRSLQILSVAFQSF